MAAGGASSRGRHSYDVRQEMKKSHCRWLFAGLATASVITVPWFWNAIEARSITGSPRVQYTLGLSSILGRLGFDQASSRAFHDAHRVLEGAVFLDYPVISREHADALLAAAGDASLSLGSSGTWGTNQDSDLDARGILRIRVPEMHKVYFSKAIKEADEAFRRNQ